MKTKEDIAWKKLYKNASKNPIGRLSTLYMPCPECGGLMSRRIYKGRRSKMCILCYDEFRKSAPGEL